MTGTRRRSAPSTRAAILDAARARFGSDGFDRVTLREIAQDVGVDPAMVVRYFGTKEKLFLAASEFDLGLPDLAGIAPGDLVDLLMPRFFAVWEGDASFLALLRTAATSPVAADQLRELFTRQVLPALAAAAVDRPEQRAALFGSQVLGLAFSRYVLGLEPLAAMSHDQLRAWIGPVLRQYLTGEPDPARRS